MKANSVCQYLLAAGLACFGASLVDAADRVIIGNVSRTVEQLPNYAATDKGFFTQEGIQGDVVLIGKYSGTDIKIDGQEYLILRESDVLAKVVVSSTRSSRKKKQLAGAAA